MRTRDAARVTARLGRRTPRVSLAGATALALAASLLGGCSASTAGSAGADDEGDRALTVLAASSLTEPLTALARAYEAEHPGVRVRLSFGSSTKLAQQVAQGAPADLVALAGTEVVEQLPAQARDPARRTVVARNVLEIATPPDDPGNVSGLTDLTGAEIAVVLCVETAPCGRTADEVLDKAGVEANVVSREVDVKSTLAKIAFGEADAAIVYHSDVVTAGGRVRGVEIPSAANTTLDYPLVRLTDRADTSGFADLVASAEGRAALADAGFLSP